MKNIKEKILDLEKDVKDLKAGTYFWASKVGKNLKKRPVKVHFNFKEDLIKEKKAELKGWKDCLASVGKVINKFLIQVNKTGFTTNSRVNQAVRGVIHEIVDEEIKKELGIK